MAKNNDQYLDWKKLILNLPDGWAATDMKGNVLDCNLAFEQLTGYTKQELSQMSFYQLTPEKWHEMEVAIVRDTIVKEGRSITYEKEYIHKDGTIIPIELSAYLVTNDDGEPLGLWAIARDISERKKAERRLINEKCYSETLINSLPGLFYVYDIDNQLIRWNKNYMDLLGYSEDEIPDMHLMDFVSEKSRESVRVAVENVFQKGFTEVLLDLVAKDGREIPYYCYGVPVELDGKNCLMGLGMDRSQLIKIEEDLKASEDKFKRIFDNMPDGYFQTDLEGNILLVNNETAVALGYESPEQLIGMNVLKDFYVNPAEREVLVSELNKAGKVRGFKVVFKKKKGDHISIELNVHLLKDQLGETVALEGIFRDISKRVEAEAQLCESISTLESIFHAAPIGIGTVVDRVIVSCNEQLCELLDYDVQEILGENSRFLYDSDEEFERVGEEKYRQIDADGIGTVETIWKKKNGELINVLLSSSPMDTKDLKQGVTFTALDFTDRVKADQDLRLAHEKLESRVKERTEELSKTVDALEKTNWEIELLTEMGDLLQVSETEKESHQIFINICSRLWPDKSGFISILDNDLDLTMVEAGWGMETDAMDAYSSCDCWALRRGKAHAVANPDSDLTCNHFHRMKGARTLCVPIAAKGITIGVLSIVFGDIDSTNAEEDQSASMVAIQEMAVRLTELYSISLANIRLRRNLHEQSIRDSLTGLFNRAYMEEALSRELELSRRTGNPVGLIMMDVDHFKQFNDDYGHETGDEILRRLGRTILKLVRSSDIVCRYGGEEILVILPDCPPEQCMDRAETIREGIKSGVNVRYGDQFLGVTVSLGVAEKTHTVASKEDFLVAADMALYRAKKLGRNRVCRFEENKLNGKSHKK